MAKRFTFKKEPQLTGLMSVGHTPSTQIKFDKKVVGMIDAPQWHHRDNLYRVRLAIKDNTLEYTNWKWITFKSTFSTEADARLWLNEKFDAIMNTYQLHQFED